MGDKTGILITYREALKQALREALLSDERVFLLGEDVGRYGGAFAVSKGLLQEFGPERIMDVPLSESGFTGAGIGAALAGMRPIVEVMTVNFSLLAMDQIVNNAATLLHMSGGQLNVPVVIRMGCGIGRQLAAQHSHSWEPLYAHIPGLIVLSVGTHEDARGMLLSALKSPDPVVIFEYTYMLNLEKEIPADAGAVDITRAKVRREGRDIPSLPTAQACTKPWMQPPNWLPPVSRPKCWTCAWCARWTKQALSPRWPKPIARWWWKKPGVPAVLPPRFRPASWKRLFTNSMPPCSASAAWRYRSPTPNTWKTPRCRK